MPGWVSTTPLPRSLDPLDDESLPGFLLRLSHRLDISPLHLAQNTGLEPAGNAIPLIRILHLTTDQSQAFAKATSLEAVEACRLTIGSLGASYRFLRLRADLYSRPERNLSGAEPWVFTGATRFCPQCLAGDGTAIQDRLGGPWRRTWRLPIVFACLEHRRLLHHLCPVCRQPAHSRDARFTRSIVLRAGVIDHPLACRSLDRDSTPCAGRFDQAGPRRPAADLPVLLERQHDLLHRLNSGNYLSAAAYFDRLRVEAAHVQRTLTHDIGPVPTRLKPFADDLRRYLSPRSRRRRTDQADRSRQYSPPGPGPRHPAAERSGLRSSARPGRGTPGWASMTNPDSGRRLRGDSAWAPGELPAPLPRALIPLPEESLTGYILRSSYRLGQSPLRFAQITRLTPGSGRSIPLAALLGFDPEANHRLAHAARLADADLDVLSGRTLLPRYLGSQYAERIITRRVRGTVNEPWFFHKPSRYCPECLSGDGSPIQNKLGGPWKLRWRLPITFTCTTHRRTLSHRCLGCAAIAPGCGSESAWPPVPRPGTPDIHPTWCRTCSADLTVDTSADPLSPTELNRALALQDVCNQILESADAAAPAMGQMIPPPTYFLDLHIITTYLQATWEGSNHPADECTEGYDAWRTRGGHTQEKSAPSRATARWPPAPCDMPPIDAAACARVLLMAADILHSPSPQAAGERLAALRYNEPRLEPWLDSIARKRHVAASDGLLQAIARLPRRFGIPRARPRAQLGSRHIPQLLPAAWWPEADERPKRGPALDVRTAAALRLAQILDGTDVTAAATELGIPPERVSRAAKTIRALEATSWVALNAAIERIHAELDSAAGPVDYGHRRQAMWSWRLSDDQWSALLDDRILLGWMRPHAQYRFYADVRIWCRVTQGLHLYSPMFRTMRRGFAAPLYTMLESPAAQAKNRVSLDALHPRIERLADSIAAAIDTGLMV